MALDELRNRIDRQFEELGLLLQDACFDTSYLNELLKKLKER